MSGELGLDRPCTLCYAQGTETYVAFDGDPGWLTAGLMALGLPRVEADATLRLVFQIEKGRYGSKTVLTQVDGLAPMPEGRHRVVLAICQPCCTKVGTRCGPRGDVPCYLQKKYKDAPRDE